MSALVFVAVCPYCLALLDAIPVEEGERWSEAECWAYLAAVKHRQQGCEP